MEPVLGGLPAALPGLLLVRSHWAVEVPGVPDPTRVWEESVRVLLPENQVYSIAPHVYQLLSTADPSIRFDDPAISWLISSPNTLIAWIRLVGATAARQALQARPLVAVGEGTRAAILDFCPDLLIHSPPGMGGVESLRAWWPTAGLDSVRQVRLLQAAHAGPALGQFFSSLGLQVLPGVLFERTGGQDSLQQLPGDLWRVVVSSRSEALWALGQPWSRQACHWVCHHEKIAQALADAELGEAIWLLTDLKPETLADFVHALDGRPS